MKIHRAWEKPPRSHKECVAAFAPKQVPCSQCGKSFTVSTSTQLKCREKGWQLPRRCEECKHDSLLIKGAIGALRDQFPFALETKIEQRGIIFTDKVAIVRNKRTGDVVAEVKMDTEGLIFVDRIAVAIDPKTGQRFSKTKEGEEGFIFTKRTADTFDAKSGKHTHRTKMEERGIIFPEKVAETRRRDGGNKEKTVTRIRDKGFIFRNIVADTDKDKDK
ncbi:MAG: hypothetical protein J5X21_15365 [Candidatus Accumulibacter sp.]|nr:hypothetical protein [Candidatus Accumulibacter conexus]